MLMTMMATEGIMMMIVAMAMILRSMVTMTMITVSIESNIVPSSSFSPT